MAFIFTGFNRVNMRVLLRVTNPAQAKMNSTRLDGIFRERLHAGGSVNTTKFTYEHDDCSSNSLFNIKTITSEILILI